MAGAVSVWTEPPSSRAVLHTPLLVTELTCDALEAVACHLSPTEICRLMQTCQALAVAATPWDPAWARLRETVQKDGWKKAITTAAKNGDIEVVRWIGAHGRPLGYLECWSSVRGGFLPVIREMRARTEDDVWQRIHCKTAAEHGHLEALQFLRAQTPPCH